MSFFNSTFVSLIKIPNSSIFISDRKGSVGPTRGQMRLLSVFSLRGH